MTQWTDFGKVNQTFLKRSFQGFVLRNASLSKPRTNISLKYLPTSSEVAKESVLLKALWRRQMCPNEHLSLATPRYTSNQKSILEPTPLFPWYQAYACIAHSGWKILPRYADPKKLEKKKLYFMTRLVEQNKLSSRWLHVVKKTLQWKVNSLKKEAIQSNFIPKL